MAEAAVAGPVPHHTIAITVVVRSTESWGLARAGQNDSAAVQRPALVPESLQEQGDHSSQAVLAALVAQGTSILYINRG
jgi:hypothetical protein